MINIRMLNRNMLSSFNLQDIFQNWQFVPSGNLHASTYDMYAHACMHIHNVVDLKSFQGLIKLYLQPHVHT